jgi:antitoxin CptB
MKNNDILKKKIIYRSTHRGTKEMDLLLGNFVKQYINNLNTSELYDLDRFTQIDDEVLQNLYLKKDVGDLVLENNISKMFKSFKV